MHFARKEGDAYVRECGDAGESLGYARQPDPDLCVAASANWYFF
jgi:hypothetical protein